MNGRTKATETPLVDKLGIKEGFRLQFINPPPSFRDALGTLPSGVSMSSSAARNIDFILVFCRSRFELEGQFGALAGKLAPTGMLWVAWPKKASRVSTDLSFDVVQSIGLAAGLVDNKVCAINDIWSALRFVIRVKDR